MRYELDYSQPSSPLRSSPKWPKPPTFPQERTERGEGNFWRTGSSAGVQAPAQDPALAAGPLGGRGWPMTTCAAPGGTRTPPPLLPLHKIECANNTGGLCFIADVADQVLTGLFQHTCCHPQVQNVLLPFAEPKGLEMRKSELVIDINQERHLLWEQTQGFSHIPGTSSSSSATCQHPLQQPRPPATPGQSNRFGGVLFLPLREIYYDL